MTIRALGAAFFLLYGLLIPVAAPAFMEANFFATLAMMGSCLAISALLWSGRALLLNILIAFYVLKVYLTRPYVGVFLPKLNSEQLAYISLNNAYFNPSDATVVYVSLLSLLLAWLFGLLITQAKQTRVVTPPWIFRQMDKIVSAVNWRFWLVLILLAVLSYRSATETWLGFATGEGSPLFAFGLLNMETIYFVCLSVFLVSRQPGVRNASPILVVPILLSAVLGAASGGRSALFNVVVFTLLYWIYLNCDKRIGTRDLKRIIVLMLLMPIIIFSGLSAQLIRPLLRTDAGAEVVREAVLEGLDVFNPDNPLVSNLYFGLTELLHRLSSLEAQFLIMNDHFINIPWESYNPLHSLMRTINDLVPGDLFPNMLSINQLFHHIYFNEGVTYSSHMWSIQGTLYLYFGLWLSPVIVVLMAYAVGRYYPKFGYLAKISPTFAVFLILLFNDVIENGTFERVIPVDVVRPLTSFLALIFLVKSLYILFPARRRFRPALL
ncbi:MAG: hypothetical protein O3B84_00170 [Chloroflexi bacterium]|nr:hypothetical protein [Chloroflexota bacterium]